MTSTSYKRQEQSKGTKRKTGEDQDQKGEEVEQNLGEETLDGVEDVDGDRRLNQKDPGQESLSGESGVEENVQGEEQDLEDKILSRSSDA